MKLNINKVMILGSGPIIIGQAAEFDYSGTQACKAIKEEGIEIVLVNSNPATIMTDGNIADKVYIEPLTVEAVEKIIEKEKPEGLLAGFGGQTALNLAMDLQDEGILSKYNVALLGINNYAIEKAEDREEFKNLMEQIGEPVATSKICDNLKDCLDFAVETGYPIIVRPAFTLGGTGGGIAKDEKELKEICEKGLKLSPIGQLLIEESVAGWKEVEYEVIRDKKDNCIIICNMENIDPVGVHTGDSIVVAPSQTLSDKEYQMLRAASIKIIRSLKIEGGCNVQFALDPLSSNYRVIEVNPRVSRSSALASKAAGYPIAKIAAKIAIGYSLDELKNYVTGYSSACFEPALDYVVLKIPKWPFDKFITASRKLGTQMKATGEVMAIGRTFESALLKAISCLEGKLTGLRLTNLEGLPIEELINKIHDSDDERIFAIAEVFRKGIEIDYIHEITKIDRWFLDKIYNIVSIEKELIASGITKELLEKAEGVGFTDDEIIYHSNAKEEMIKDIRKENSIYPVYKMVDTCSGEFEAITPYYYSCYEQEDESVISDNEKIVVIGSGPIRIGQGIEFDYSCVHGVWAIKESGYESIIINNNPETVSTDFDTADKLYFESLYIDDVLNVIRKEKPKGVIVQLGGQTSINLVERLEKAKVNILGTSYASIDMAEDRDKFRAFLDNLGICSPKGYAVKSFERALEVAEEIGYPVMARPSYVIGGRAMKIVYNKDQLKDYIHEAMNLSDIHSVIIDKYIKGTEIEVDAICDGEDILIPGIMEHVERTGIHSGDSITVYPSITLPKDLIKKLKEHIEKIAVELNIIGLINIQYVYDGEELYVIEVNPRASRTVPILSKVTKVPMVKLAVDAMLGKKLKESSFGTGLLEESKFYAVKIPVFSTEKLSDVDVFLGPEMKSTGEVLGIDKDFDVAVYKGFQAIGVKIQTKGNVYISLNDVDKAEGINLAKEYSKRGVNIYASKGTSKALEVVGINSLVITIDRLKDLISQGEISIIINTPTVGNINKRDGFKIRRLGAEYKVPVFTSIDTAKIFIKAIDVVKNKDIIQYKSMEEHFE